MASKRPLLLAVVVLLGCAKEELPNEYTWKRTARSCSLGAIASSISPEVLPYVEEFVSDAGRYDANCFKVNTIKMVPTLTGGVVGYCRPRITVALSQEYWDKSTPTTRRTLVYHELGHCALNLDHGKDDDWNDIMNPYVLPDYLAENDWYDLVKRLFTGEK